MNIKFLSIPKILFATLLTIIQIQLFDVFKLIKILTAYVPKTYITLIENYLDIGVIFGFNLFLISVLTTGWEHLIAKYAFFSKISSFLKSKKLFVCILSVFLVILIIPFLIFIIDIKYSLDDYSPPTISSKMTSNSVVMSKQYENPIVYHLIFDDETNIQCVFFDESYVTINDCSADISINQLEDFHYVLSMNNIDGQTGEHQVTIKEGAVIDASGNASNEVKLSVFYLYDSEDEVDTISPQVQVEKIKGQNDSCLTFDISCIDDNDLSSVYIHPDDVILIGFEADVKIEITKNAGRRIILSNLSYPETLSDCKLVISSGIATDAWGNKSAPYIIDNLEFE